MDAADAVAAWEFFCSAWGFGFAFGWWFYLVAYFLSGGGRLIRDWLDMG